MFLDILELRVENKTKSLEKNSSVNVVSNLWEMYNLDFKGVYFCCYAICDSIYTRRTKNMFRENRFENAVQEIH